MCKRQQKKECAKVIRMFVLISCGILFFACGKTSGDHETEPEVPIAGEQTGQESAAEQETFAETESRQTDLEDSIQPDSGSGEKVSDGKDEVPQEGEYNYYGEGCIYFYMNEDEPYCFRDEEYPFFFGFNIISGDFDADGNTEIAFESLGSGVGGAGDWHPRILKYKDHTMEPMEFPADDYDGRGVRIVITQEEKWDTYSAYCAYLDETIVFEAKNIFDPDASQSCGGNSRGYFNLWRGEYEGRDALEVSELLYGEGGTAHGLGFAKFLIVWDENGDGQIVKWWIEPWEDE